MADRRADEVFQRIGTAIARGDVAPGDTLPIEAALMEAHDAGRSTIREAVRSLSDLGMVRTGARRGTVVRPRAEWKLLNRPLLDWLLDSPAHRDATLAGITELRRTVEPAAAEKAAQRATRREIIALETACLAMEEAAARNDPAAAVLADQAFHRALLAATGNPVLGALGAVLDGALAAFLAATAVHMDRYRANLPNHLAVLAAVRRGDPAAARAAMDAMITYTDDQLRAADAAAAQTGADDVP